MTEALVVSSFAEGQELARSLKQSALVPEALRGKEADILFITLTGAEMGLGPMKSLQAFEVIKGRVGMKPVYMMGMVRAHPSILSIDFEEGSPSATKAVVLSVRKNNPNKVLRTEFTIDDAKTAGLTSSDMYRKWPARMLGWRCVAIHCRENHSDIIGGHYSTEEVGAFERDISPKPPVVDAQPAVEAVKAALKAKPKRVMNVVDVPAAVASPPRVEGDGVVLDWPPNREGRRIETLSRTDLEWCINAAKNAVEKVADDEKPAWFDRMANFTAELARRGNAG